MKRRAALLLGLSALFAVLAAHPADPPRQWVCLDGRGNEVLQPRPCAEVNTEFRSDDVPPYVWGIVALLGVAWVLVLMPERLPYRWRQDRKQAPDLPPPGAPEPPQARPQAPAPAPLQAAPPARPTGWSLETIARLSPRRFDELVQALWQANGYKAVASGTDVQIRSPASGNLFAVAQRSPSPAEAVPAEAVASLWERVQRSGGLGICYSVAGFATDALMFAQGKRLKLVSGAELLAQLRALKPEQQRALLEHVSR